MAVSATAIWRVRTAGSNVNGGGYDAGISGAGTDYSQQDAAQASGSNGTASASTTFSDSTANAFTSAMVGNAIWIASGSGFTTGAYFVTGYTSASTVTLDRSPGTGTVAIWKLGGGWADPATNLQSSTYLVGGNIVYVRGSGSDTPSAADYTITTQYNLSTGSTNGMWIKILGENGRPCILVSTGLAYWQANYYRFEHLWFRMGLNGSCVAQANYSSGCTSFFDVVFDQFGYDCTPIGSAQYPFTMTKCEVFSSVSKRTTNTNFAVDYVLNTSSGGNGIFSCNIHDTIGPGVRLMYTGFMVNTIVANCGGAGVTINETVQNGYCLIGNTIDANGGSGGIVFTGSAAMNGCSVVANNIISNHSGVGQAALVNSMGITSAQVAVQTWMCLGNALYNNTSDCTSMTLPSGNTSGTSPAFTNQANEDYSLTSAALLGLGAGLPTNHLSGKTTTVTSVTPGASQPSASSGATYVINKITTNFIQGDDYAPAL